MVARFVEAPALDAVDLLSALAEIEPRGLRELRAINRGGSRCARRWYTGVAPSESVAMAVRHAVQAAETGFDLYYSLNARLEPSGARPDVISVDALCADVDMAECWTRVEALRLKGFAPSAVVASGRGWHVYYFLAAPIAVQDGEQLNADLATYLESDRTWDATRCPRLPGTINWRWRTRVWLVSLDPDRRYTADFVREMLPYVPLHARSAAGVVDVHFEAEPRRSWQQLGVPPRLCEMFPVYATSDRSRLDAAVALALRERSADLATVAEALQAPPRSKLAEKLQTQGEQVAATYLVSTVDWADSVLARKPRPA